MCYQGVLSRFFPSHFAPCFFSLHHVAFDTPVKANFTYVQPRNSPRAIHLPSASPYGTSSQKKPTRSLVAFPIANNRFCGTMRSSSSSPSSPSSSPPLGTRLMCSSRTLAGCSVPAVLGRKQRPGRSGGKRCTN